MKCTRCGKCCEMTMMELSEEDMSRLEDAGHHREDFMVFGQDAISRLRNVQGSCFFLEHQQRKCRVYDIRPIGCELYPVNCDADGLLFADELCPASGTVSRNELKRSGERLHRQLRTIDEEAKRRRGGR